MLPPVTADSWPMVAMSMKAFGKRNKSTVTPDCNTTDSQLGGYDRDAPTLIQFSPILV